MVLKLFKGDLEIKPGMSIVTQGGVTRVFNHVSGPQIINVTDSNVGDTYDSYHTNYMGYEIRYVPETACPSIDEVIDVLRKAFPARAFGDVKTEPAPVPKMHVIADAAHDRFPNSDTARACFIAGAQWAFKQGK